MITWKKFMEGRKELAMAYRDTLKDVPQDPIHHPEGTTLIHSKLVRNAIPKAIQELKTLQADPNMGPALSNINFDCTPEEMQILALAAWLHDIGKATATVISPEGKITSAGHQDREHFEPQLKKLQSIAPPETIQLYLDNQELIDFLILHHMDLMNPSGFGKGFVDQHFAGGKVQNSEEMKLLLILMWSDKMGRRPEDTIANALRKNVSGLQASVKRNTDKEARMVRNPPFSGGPEQFVQMLGAKNLNTQQKRAALLGKFPGVDAVKLIPEGFRRFCETVQHEPTIIPAQIPVGKDVRILANALKHPFQYGQLWHPPASSVEVYIVGGVVRDWLYHQHNGKPGTKFSPKDEDMTTNLSEEEILIKLRSPYAMKLGIRVKEKESVDTFGVVFASVDGGETVEIAPFRKDIGGSDGRRPDRIERGTIHDDAMRRDLTMNNLYYDFDKGVIIDLNQNGQGIEDVKAGLARPVGDPVQRFQEDVLRVLRMVRFFSRFNSGSMKKLADKQSLAAIEQFKNLHDYPGITPERIQMEFSAGIKQSQNTASFLSNLAELDLMPAVFPGMTVDTASLGRIGNSKNPRVIMAWILRQNPRVGESLNRLKYSNEISEPVEFLVNTMNFGEEQAVDVVKMRDRALIRTGKKKTTLTPDEEDSNARIIQQMHNDIMELSRIVGVNLEDQGRVSRMQHLAKYQPPQISGQELMQQGFAGSNIGIEQKRLAQQHYIQSFQGYSPERKQHGEE